MPKTDIIHIRVSPNTKKGIAEAAAADNRTISAWCAMQLEIIVARLQKRAAR